MPGLFDQLMMQLQAQPAGLLGNFGQQAVRSRPEVGPFPDMGNPIRPNPLAPSYNLNFRPNLQAVPMSGMQQMPQAGNLGAPTMSDESQYPVMPGQQYAANTPSRSGIDMNAMRKLEDLRRQLGVQASTPGGRDTDAALKAIEEALRYAPK